MMKAELKNRLLETGYFINNDSLAQYIDLVINPPKTDGYSEWHHILQKQYFRLSNTPIDESNLNKVLLLYKDHCKAHWLLYYCTVGELKRANAAAVQYIVNIYNEVALANKTREKLSEDDFALLQHYYDDIRNSEDSKYYSADELNFLKKNYPANGAKYCAAKLGRTEDSIRNEIVKLGLKRQWSWTEDDIGFLKCNYEEKGGSYCAKQLNKSKKSVFKKAKQLGLSRYNQKAAKNGWSKTELAILTTYFPLEGSKVYLRLPNRSYNACRCQAYLLKLRHSKKGAEHNVKR